MSAENRYVYLHSILTFWKRKLALWTLFCPVYWTHVHYYRDVLVRVQDHSSNSQDQEAKWQTRVVQVQLPGLHLHHSALVWHYFTTAVPLFFFFFFENSIFKTLVWVNLSQIECRECSGHSLWKYSRNLKPHQCTLTQCSYKNKRI